MHTFLRNVRVLGVLLKRDLVVMGASVRSSLIDCVIQASVLSFIQGYLFPHMGMPTLYIGALSVGSIVLFLFMQNANMSFRLQADIAYSGFIHYQIMLPLSKNWFLARYVIRFALQSMFISLPTLIFVFTFLWGRIPNIAISPLPFLIIYPLVLLSISSLLVAIGLLYDFTWLRANMWRRRIDPLIFSSTMFVAWQAAYTFSPRLATLLLCNPVTHMVESLRTCLLSYSITPSLWLNILVLLATIAGNCYLMRIGLKRRLDPA